MTYFQAVSGLWDSNGGGNRYMDQLLSTGNPAGLRAYSAQLRAVSAELGQLERDYRELAHDLEQAWPQGRARQSWVSLANDTGTAYESMRRVIADGDNSLAGITDQHADEVQRTQASSMTKSILVDAILGALNSNPWTASLVSPTGAMAAVETVAELAEVATTINTFYQLYKNLTGDDESHQVRGADSQYASTIPMAQGGYNGPYIPASYAPGQYSPYSPYGPAGYPAGPYGPAGSSPTGGYQPYGGFMPSSGFPSTGNVVPGTGYAAAGGGGGAVPGFTPVDPGTGDGNGGSGSGNGHGSGHGHHGDHHGSNHGNHGNHHGHHGGGSDGVTVTVHDGDASFEVTTTRDGHFSGELHGQQVTVDVDVADDHGAGSRAAPAHRRTG